MHISNRMACLGLVALVFALGACTETSKRIRFEGEYYRAKAKAPRSDRHNFVVTSGPLDRGLEGARQAALYEGAMHCMRYYGTSDVVWAVHPTEGDPNALTRERNRIAVRGRCIEWPERGS